MKFSVLIVFVLTLFWGMTQNIFNEINAETYDNFSHSYNYTYWNDSWKTTTTQNRSFSNQTSAYALNIDYTNLTIQSLLLTDSTNIASLGFSALNSAIFPANFSGNIDYSIVHSGPQPYQKAATPTGLGNMDSQMAEYGVWCNRRFISTKFTNNAPVDAYFTGVECTNWHDRFKMTFHVKPTALIINGQLRLSVEIPAQYVQHFTNGSLHAFGLDSEKGFVIKGGESVQSLNVVGNVVTVLTTAQNLVANTAYEVSILFHPVRENLSTTYTSIFSPESAITLTANQTAPAAMNLSSSVTYSADEGMHIIDIPRYQMGQYNCAQADDHQVIDFSLTNSSAETKRVKLCIRQIPNVNVTGFNSVICNSNGDPAGLPLQVSKNWHTTTAQLFSGAWIKEYTELILPANSTLNFQYKRTGAKWGETYAASSHQLCVAGAGIPRGGWLEAALGSFGESITHSPDYEYGNTNGADLRPFLVTNENYGGTSTECNWTGNVGGLNMWVYANSNSQIQYQSEVKTKFTRYSPNLSETTVGAVSEDKKLKLDYTFYLNRSDDYNRIYYKVNIEALQNTTFNRFDIFQLGGDNYNIQNARNIVYGNDTGVVAQFLPTNSGSNNYTTAEIPLIGNNPWLWAGDALAYTGASSGIDIDANTGFIIRDYKATLNGVENNTPYFRERSSNQGFSASHGTNPTSYCIVPPPGTTSFTQGDKIELVVEVAVLPKTYGDYYGPNAIFDSIFNVFGNSHELLLREAQGNKITAESPTNVVHTSYPLSVETIANTGLVNITGGKGYVPLVFTGLTNISNPRLWRAKNTCWEMVDQSVHGKDFWQTNYQPTTETFDLVYNVNQDQANDSAAVIYYYLGETPPMPSLLAFSKVGNNAATSNPDVSVISGGDDVVFQPEITELGTISNGIDANFQWTGPNNFVSTGRLVNFSPVTNLDEGAYRVVYTNEYGCTDTNFYSITIDGYVNLKELADADFRFYPNPVKNKFSISAPSYQTTVFTIAGQKVLNFDQEETVFEVNSLPKGLYFVEFQLQNNQAIRRIFIKE